MTQEKDSKNNFSGLRSQAEELLGTVSVDQEDISALSSDQIQRLVHELRVHQIELEMQNEELRQAHLKLEELKNKYLDLYDFAPVGYMTLNDRGLILEANLTVVKLLGVERTSLIKMFLSHFICQEFVNAYYLYLKQVFESQSRQTCEIKLTRKDGTIFDAQLESIPVQDESGHYIRCRTILSDITERKLAEKEKENLRAQLLQSQKMETMGTLAAGIAHDFNNMLTVILGFSDMLLADKNKGDHGYEELQKIVKTSQDAADLVQKIRIFGRKAEMNLIPLDLNHQIDEVTKLITHTLTKMIDIDIHLTKDPVIIKADASQIAQMVMNLAVNANEAMAQRGRLSIQTENIVLDNDYCRVHLGAKPGPHVLLTVSDTGRGIDKGLMERIFDPFYSTKTRDYRKGTGLGLSVVQGIVQQHGGHITVESEVGKGTIFRMYFPALEHEIVPEYVETKIPYSAGGTETILLVEDMELVRDLGVTILEKFGYTVLSAGDGQEALDVYEKEQGNISLVILDILMPRMDGKECLEQLLRINPAVKVIISSGVGQEDLIQDVVKIGAKGAVNKPYGMRQILGMVRQVLDGD
jgi:PAS domain S-box-containing protein